MEHSHILTRKEVSEMLLSAKRKKDITFQELAKELGRDKVWVAAAMYGKATMDKKEAETLCNILQFKERQDEVVSILCEPPMRSAPEGCGSVSSDPTIYRFYEIMHVYAEPFKAILHEEFGDGIMSAITFEARLEKQKRDDGDHVVITLDGKFLPYKKW